MDYDKVMASTITAILEGAPLRHAQTRLEQHQSPRLLRKGGVHSRPSTVPLQAGADSVDAVDPSRF